MAEPVLFAGANCRLTPPAGSENVGELATFTNGHCSVSCWALSPEEIGEIVRTGRVFLSVLSGRTQPPVYVGTEEGVRALVVDYGDVWPAEGRAPDRIDDAALAALSRTIIALLPDDAGSALSVLALTFANAVTVTGKSDRTAFSALGLALKEARGASRKSKGRVVL